MTGIVDRPGRRSELRSGPGRVAAPPSAHRWLVTAPRLGALAVVTAAAVGTALSSRSGLAAVLRDGLSPGVTAGGVILVGSLVLGLPHGAVDLARLDGSWRDRAPVAAGYLLLTGLAAAVFVLLPLDALLGLSALAVVHFGTADLEFHDDTGDAPRHRVQRAAVIAAGGGIPVVVPLGLHGRAVLGVLDGLTARHGTSVIDVCRTVLPLLAAAVLVVGVDAARRRRWGAAADLVVLLVLFIAVSPLLAFAAYFGLWHAWRQTGLMMGADSRVWRVSLPVAGVRLLRQAAAPSLIAVAVVAVLAVIGNHTVVVWGLAAVLCLTVPHAVMTARSTWRRHPSRFVSAQ